MIVYLLHCLGQFDIVTVVHRVHALSVVYLQLKFKMQ